MIRHRVSGTAESRREKDEKNFATCRFFSDFTRRATRDCRFFGVPNATDGAINRPMRVEIEWGYIIPYMVTGVLNEHPRSAIAVRKTENRDKYAEFYEEILEELD